MYVIWIKSVESGNVWLAGVASVLLALPSLLGFLEITENKRMMAPYLLGLFCGTIFGISYLA